MPARRKAASGKDSSGRQKRAARKTAGPKTTDGGRPSADEIREKMPTPKKQLPERESVAERRKRKSGVADSAITEPKPKSNRATPKKETAAKKRDTTRSSGQTPAVRTRRAAAPRPQRARKQSTAGAQARKKTANKKSGS